MLKPKYLKDIAGQLPSYVNLGTLAADAVVTQGRINAAISTAPSTTRVALGLGSAALSASTDFASSAQDLLAGTALQPGTLPLGTTLNSTEANSLVNYTRVNSALGTNPSGIRTTLGLGSAALAATTAFATAAQGTLAGTALQPGTLPLGTTLSSTDANTLVNTTRVQSAISGDIDGTKTILGITNSGGIGGGVVEKFNRAGFSTIGANVYSVLIRYMYGGLTDAQLDNLFSYCASMGATTIRIMYPCFSKTELDIYVHSTTTPGTNITDASFKSTFLTMSDKVFERAAATGVKLIPCLFWNWELAPSIFSEALPGAYATLNTQTCLYMKSFTEWFTKRYKNNSALLAYSFTNEWKWSTAGTSTPTPEQLQVIYTMLHETVRKFDSEHLTMIDLPGPSIELGPTRKFLDTFIEETLQVTKSIDIIGTHIYIDTTDWTGRKTVSGGGAVPSPTNALGYEDAAALISELNIAASLAGKVLYVGEFGIATTQELDTLSAKKTKILEAIANNCAGGMVWDVNYATGAAGNQAIWLIEPGTARGNLWNSLIIAINNQYKIPRLAHSEPSAFGKARKSVFIPKEYQTYTNTATGNAKFTLSSDMCQQEISIMFWIRKNSTPSGFSRVARIQDTSGVAGGPGIIVLFDTNGGEVYADLRSTSGSAGSTAGILPSAPVGEFNHIGFTHMRVNNSWLLDTWYNGFCVESRTTNGLYVPPPVGAIASLGGTELSGNTISTEGFCIAGAVTPEEIRKHLAGTDPRSVKFSTRRDQKYISWGSSVVGVQKTTESEDIFPKTYRRVGSYSSPVASVTGLYKEGFITAPEAISIKPMFEGSVNVKVSAYKNAGSGGSISVYLAKLNGSYSGNNLTGATPIVIPGIEWFCSIDLTVTVSSAFVITEYTLETSSGITTTLCETVPNTNYSSAQELTVYASGLSGSTELKTLKFEAKVEDKVEENKIKDFWRAVTVSKNFFGLNSVDWPTRAPTGGGTGSSPPAFGFGTISTMDCNALHWRSLHTATNTINWTSLDTFVTQAKAAGATRGIYVLYGTPTFLAQASQAAQAGVYGGLGEGSYPTTLAQLTYFVTQFNTRNSGTYAGFFDTIQVWANLDTDATMFSGVASASSYFWGSAPQFADVITTVKAALTAASSSIIVGTPSINRAESNLSWLTATGLTTGVVAATAVGAICANAYSLKYNEYKGIGRSTVASDRYVGVKALRKLATSVGLSENISIEMVSFGLSNNSSDGALTQYQTLTDAERITYIKRMYVAAVRAGVKSICPWSYGSVSYYVGSLVADTQGTIAGLTQVHNELVGRTIISGGYYTDGQEYLELSDGTTYTV